MGDDQAVDLQQLIDDANRGDDDARRELFHRAYERLRHLSAKILRRNFSRLRGGLVDPTDVANEVAFRLFRTLDEIKPATVQDFFRLAAQRIRWLLLDLARQTDRAGPKGRHGGQPVESWQSTARSEVPQGLAELYQRIESLPEHEREVVDLLYFHGLNQSETANQMGVTERTVRRYWTTARARLFRALIEGSPPAAAGIALQSDRFDHV
jgi:RNA polymerase sigma factor (TIGR02999 family)